MKISLGREFRTRLVDAEGFITPEWQRKLSGFYGFDEKPLPVYANNAAALAAGLKAGDFYRTGDNLCVVH